MSKRFVAIWFRYLRTDWFSLRRPTLQKVPFILAAPDHGRMVITAVNPVARAAGIDIGMVVADARVMASSLQVIDDKPNLDAWLLKRLAEWCIRYTPIAAIDLPDGLILDVTGCAHLWGGEEDYLTNITNRFNHFGYSVRAAMADTIGAAWAAAHFATDGFVIKTGMHADALLALPPSALRLEPETTELLQKLGLRQVRDFMRMPRPVLRRRFGTSFINRLNQAIGSKEEFIEPVIPIEPYQERLPCLEPITTATGIEIALQRLLESLCRRLQQEQKGLRTAVFKGYRVDGKIESVSINTNRPSHHVRHLYKLFEIKLSSIEPALGLELFTLDAQKVEEAIPLQHKLWEGVCGVNDIELAELLDRMDGKFGQGHIYRYLPAEHHWPERSIKAASLQEPMATPWRTDRQRPMQLLQNPEPIEVTAPIPDYPPMLFRYNGKLHKILKADGPERIEQEWWLQQGQHRDYYCVEDENGYRYWLFRSGHYTEKDYKWFIHGFFA